MTTSTGEGAASAHDQPKRRGVIPEDTFASRLVLVRLHCNITIQEAAAKTGLNYGSWSNWERGAKPRDILDVVQKIADGLGIDDEWLLFGGALTNRSRRGRRQGDGDGIIGQYWHANLGGPTATERPRDNRPNGGPGSAVPNPATRRPVRLGINRP